MKRKFLLMVFCAAMMRMTSTIPEPEAWAQTAPQRIDITAKRFQFSPGEISVKKGQPVVLVLRSADVNHGLRFRDFGINVEVKAGKTVEVKFTPDKTGDFVGHCSVFCGAGHGTMEIKLHVVA